MVAVGVQAIDWVVPVALPVNEVCSPIRIDLSGPASTTGLAVTLIVTGSVLTQPFKVAVTVNVVFAVTFAVGLAVLVLFNPVPGVHAYAVPVPFVEAIS